MNLVCDAAVERPIVQRLREEDHHVLYIAEIDPEAEDDVVLAHASGLNAPLVTIDKDFGELVFRQGRATAGVILVRLAGLTNQAKAEAVASTIRDHRDEIPNSFTVISPGRVRIRRKLSP